MENYTRIVTNNLGPFFKLISHLKEETLNIGTCNKVTPSCSSLPITGSTKRTDVSQIIFLRKTRTYWLSNLRSMVVGGGVTGRGGSGSGPLGAKSREN